MTTIETTSSYEIGQEVANQIVEIDGGWHNARVKIVAVESEKQIDRPSWMPADSEGGKAYPLTNRVYQVEVLHSRPSTVPAVSDQLPKHLSKIGMRPCIPEI